MMKCYIMLVVYLFFSSKLLAYVPFATLDLKENMAYQQVRAASSSHCEPLMRELIEGHFIPLGWRGNRIFAYLLLPANEARDCSWGELRIQDLSNDRILFSKEYELCSSDSDIDEQHPEKMTKLLWERYGSRITEVLTMYRISRMPT